MSQSTTLLSELAGSEKLSPGVLAYLGERARNRHYDYVIKRFRDSGITKAELARRIGKGQDRINRLLSSPGNWTIDTVAELLAGICAEELLPLSAPILGRPERNITQSDLLGVAAQRGTWFHSLTGDEHGHTWSSGAPATVRQEFQMAAQ